jgi:hypothetical protein
MRNGLFFPQAYGRWSLRRSRLNEPGFFRLQIGLSHIAFLTTSIRIVTLAYALCHHLILSCQWRFRQNLLHIHPMKS